MRVERHTEQHKHVPVGHHDNGADEGQGDENGVEVHVWVKATEGEMTGVFGIIHNHAATDVTVTSATSPLTKRVELHEVVMVDGAMKMQPKAGGFMLPAKGSHELAPGHDHIMLMGLSAPLKTGTTVEVTLHMSDGTTVTFTGTGPSGCRERSYQPSPTMSGMTSLHHV